LKCIAIEIFWERQSIASVNDGLEDIPHCIKVGDCRLSNFHNGWKDT